MSHTLRILTGFAVLLVVACGTGRTAFTPESGPPTVGMPAALNERERLFAPDIESSLRANGLLPVRYGVGDMELEFTMATGPINTDTEIALRDGRSIVARGKGRASGLPLIGRSGVAENSFRHAFDQFESELAAASASRGWSPQDVPGSYDPAQSW